MDDSDYDLLPNIMSNNVLFILVSVVFFRRVVSKRVQYIGYVGV